MVSDIYISRFSSTLSEGELSTLRNDVSIDSLSRSSTPQFTLSTKHRGLMATRFQQTLASSSALVMHQARWNSIKDGSAKSVFSCFPNEKHNTFPNSVFACMIRQHLGLPHTAISSRRTLSFCKFCNSVMDPRGTHAIDCKSNGVYGRHEDVKHILANLCLSAGIGCAIEPPRLDSDSAARPADISIPRWNQSAAWIDIAVVNPICSSRLIGSAQILNLLWTLLPKTSRGNMPI